MSNNFSSPVLFLLTNVSDPPDVYVAMDPQVVSEEAEYGQVTLRCELASGHPAILTNVTWYKVRNIHMCLSSE